VWPARMSGTGQVAGDALGVRGEPDRVRAIGRRDARGLRALHADGDAERGPAKSGILLDHHRKVEFVAALVGHGHADQAPPVSGHEVDRLGGRVLRSADEVPLVFATLVVHDDQGAPLPDLLDPLLDGGESLLFDFLLVAHPS